MPRREEIPERVLRKKVSDALVSEKDELTGLVERQLASRRAIKARGGPIVGVREQHDLELRAFEMKARRKLARVRGEEKND